MRRAATYSLIAVLMLGAVACTKTGDKQAKSDKAEATATATDTTLPKPSSPEALKALTPDQQAAVRTLIRDTLIQNPEILLEAQRSYEAKQERAQNEKVAKSFADLKSKHGELAFGPANAKVTMIEFFDYKCTYCHAANDWVWAVIAKRPDVRVIFKELPVLSENSHTAAKAAIASHKQGKYKEFHRALMTARGDLGLDQILEIATSVGLDVTRLQKDMADPKVEAQLTGVRQQATDLGINGTPGFVINGSLVAGFSQDRLDAALGAAGIDATAALAK
jgi:protein-disulfide isomerase